MKKQEIKGFAKQITMVGQSTIIEFNDGTKWVGYFDNDKSNPSNEENNQWSFVKFNDNNKIHRFNGEDVLKIYIEQHSA